MCHITPYFIGIYIKFQYFLITIEIDMEICYNICMDKTDQNKEDEKYSKIIQDFLPYERQSMYLSGSEGMAFFVGDDYVIKKYPQLSWVDVEGLYYYYDEILKFHNAGINLPKFYQYFVDPDHSFYILQERIKGESLRVDFLEFDYPMFAKLCSRKEYDEILEDPSKNILLFSEIVMIYAHKFVEISKMLEGVSDKELEKFVLSVFYMYENAHYSRPDCHSTNVFLTDKGMYHIDNYMINSHEFKKFNSRTADERKSEAFMELFKMLEENDVLNQLFYDYKVCMTNDKLYKDLKKITEQNVKVCREVTNKLAKVIKRAMDNPEIIGKKELNFLYTLLCRIFPNDSEEMTRDVASIFNKI